MASSTFSSSPNKSFYIRIISLPMQGGTSKAHLTRDIRLFTSDYHGDDGRTAVIREVNVSHRQFSSDFLRGAAYAACICGARQYPRSFTHILPRPEELRSPYTHNKPRGVLQILDRKSTRLNSSHANISYAVFCLK